MADPVKQVFASTVKIIMSSLTGGWLGFATQTVGEAIDVWKESTEKTNLLDSQTIIEKTTEIISSYAKSEEWEKERSIALGQVAASRWKRYKPSYQEMAEFSFDQNLIVNRVIGDGDGLDKEDVEPVRMIIAMSVAQILKSALPELINAYMQESLQRSKKILELVNKQTEDKGQFEQKYRKAIVGKLDTVEPYGHPGSWVSIRNRLSSVYVMMQGSCVIEKSDSSTSESTTGSLDEILPYGRRFFIHGEAGYGKTIFLKWLAIQVANKQFKNFLEPWNYFVPFYFQLRDYSDELPLPEEFPNKILGSAIALKPSDWVTQNLEMGSALLLIDGLDEVPASKREKVRHWLNDILLNFRNTSIIITSRPASIPEGWVKEMGMIDIQLEPMNIFIIENIIRRWFASISEMEYTYSRGAIGELMNVVKHNREIRSLMANPALCTLFCRTFLEYHSIPSTYLALIRLGLETLLERRDTVRGIEIDYHYLGFSNSKILLSQIAYWLIRNGRFSVTEEEAKIVIQPALQRIGISNKDINSVLRYLKERVGVLREPELNKIEFLYLAFQEYLAAEAIIEVSDYDFALQNSHISYWRGVVINISGLAPKSLAESFILKLIKHISLRRKNKRYLQILALECFGTFIKENKSSEDVQQFIIKLLSSIAPPRNMVEANSFASVGELAIPYLSNQQHREEKEIAACLRGLQIIGTSKALETIKEYKYDSRAQVTLELMRIADQEKI